MELDAQLVAAVALRRFANLRKGFVFSPFLCFFFCGCCFYFLVESEKMKKDIVDAIFLRLLWVALANVTAAAIACRCFSICYCCSYDVCCLS